MSNKEALQIAKLLNERNELVRHYTAEHILEKKDNYVYLKVNDDIIACAESKKVQWYQWEISHLSVSVLYEGQGFGKQILKLAEDKAVTKNAKLLQCTIRASNASSIRLFERSGYVSQNKFYNSMSGNWVLIFQKIVSKLSQKNNG